jgi:PmbA protein
MVAGEDTPAAPALQDRAGRALERLRRRGFDQALACAVQGRHTEVSCNHNQASLLRSTETARLQLVALHDGRRASIDAVDGDLEALDAAVRALHESVLAAPQDEAHALAAGQHLRHRRGPLGPPAGELAAGLADAMAQLLDWRATNAPKVMIEEGVATHTERRLHLLSSGGSDIACDSAWFGLSVYGCARDERGTSSADAAGGHGDRLELPTVHQAFGIADTLQALERQIVTAPLGGRFVGDVVLAPQAVGDLLDWLLEQLADEALIDGSSLYRQRVGELVASPQLTLRSRFEASPGVLPLSADFHVAAPLTLLDRGRLQALTPSLYGSRKTGLPHRPLAAGGWALDAGEAPLADLLAGVPRGAWVSRLSMGAPAANGDFSAVVKNSFRIDDGRLGPALADTMVSGNMARMLTDIVALSRERRDTGDALLPWLRISGLHFS